MPKLFMPNQQLMLFLLDDGNAGIVDQFGRVNESSLKVPFESRSRDPVLMIRFNN